MAAQGCATSFHTTARDASCRGYGEEDADENSSHLVRTPVRPPEMRAARLVRARGKARPVGEAKYLGSHSGLNFSRFSLSEGR